MFIKFYPCFCENHAIMTYKLFCDNLSVNQLLLSDILCSGYFKQFILLTKSNHIASRNADLHVRFMQKPTTNAS